MKEIKFETIIGSHVWKMNHEKSDIDIFRCYVEDSNKILLGHTPKNSCYEELDGEIDVQESEIGKVIEQLLDNNFNYIVAIFSPIVRFENGSLLNELRKIGKSALSKKCYNSVYGLATVNYIKYIESGKDTSEKRCNVICRTLQFGITLLNEHSIDFKEYNTGTPEKIIEMLNELEKAKENSTLPDSCSDGVKKEAEEFLLKIRKEMI